MTVLKLNDFSLIPKLNVYFKKNIRNEQLINLFSFL